MAVAYDFSTGERIMNAKEMIDHSACQTARIKKNFNKMP
jgi:hypothetical protein